MIIGVAMLMKIIQVHITLKRKLLLHKGEQGKTIQSLIIFHF